jgi:hypothetical protein
MKIRHALSVMLAVLLALAVMPAQATDSHDYAKGEYAIIRNGLAPGKTVSLAAHADENGENFHVWLMAEPAHRRIVPLAAIEARLDTGPDAYRALWSEDSHHVAISFRSDRHIAELNIYNIENRHAHLVFGPSLFKDVTGRETGSQDDLRTSYAEIEWRGSDRFVLREHRLFKTSDAGFAGRLGKYGKVTDKADDGGMFVEFSAEADGMLMPGNRYRIVDLRAGKFDDAK